MTLKRCAPKLVSKRPFPDPGTFKVGNGEKATGYSPVVAFEILESGEVQKARLKRSSGISDRDAHALKSIHGWKFNARPGCGTIEMESDVLVLYH
jgi:TonB family protein